MGETIRSRLAPSPIVQPASVLLRNENARRGNTPVLRNTAPCIPIHRIGFLTAVNSGAYYPNHAPTLLQNAATISSTEPCPNKATARLPS